MFLRFVTKVFENGSEVKESISFGSKDNLNDKGKIVVQTSSVAL